jgi:hypothetical protein
MNYQKNVTAVDNRSNTQSSPSHRTEQGKSKSAVSEERTTKADTNRKNALKSTGPKTPRGKSYSRTNALKHGLYSKELLVSEADKPEFEEMHAGLEAGLKPSTTLQGFAFDYIVVCHWRCKLAARLDHRQFARQFQDEQPENERGEASDVDPVIERWYGSSRADIRAGIRFLEYAMAEFENHGSFREDTKKFLMSGFGPHFVPLLEKWNTMSKDAILLADMIDSKHKNFRVEEIPDLDVKSPSTLGETTKVVIDPMQGRHMVAKLLEERTNFLRELLAITGQNQLGGKAAAAPGVEFNPRFLADANRELRRALSWYFFLKENNL